MRRILVPLLTCSLLAGCAEPAPLTQAECERLVRMKNDFLDQASGPAGNAETDLTRRWRDTRFDADVQACVAHPPPRHQYECLVAARDAGETMACMQGGGG